MNAAWLVASRALQGIGAALLVATSAAIVTAVFPPRERGRALGINVTAVYLGLSVGPPLGGFLTDHLSWRWVFYVNMPIGLVALMLGTTAATFAAPLFAGDGKTGEPYPGSALCLPDAYLNTPGDCLPLGPSQTLTALAQKGLTFPPRPLPAAHPARRGGGRPPLSGSQPERSICRCSELK